MKDQNRFKCELRNPTCIMLGLGLAIVLFCIMWPLIYPNIFTRFFGENHDFAASGNFADGYGILIAMFSGLGFVGLIATLTAQQEALKNQREQHESEHFQSMFRFLIEDLERIIGTFEHGGNNGHSAFISASEHLQRSIVTTSMNQHLTPRERFANTLESTKFKKYIPLYAMYFYNIMQYIESSGKEDVQFYKSTFILGIHRDELNLLNMYSYIHLEKNYDDLKKYLKSAGVDYESYNW